MDRAANEITQWSLRELAAHVKTTHAGNGEPIILFNPLSWTRGDVVEVEAQLPSPAEQIEFQTAGGGNSHPVTGNG